MSTSFYLPPIASSSKCKLVRNCICRLWDWQDWGEWQWLLNLSIQVNRVVVTVRADISHVVLLVPFLAVVFFLTSHWTVMVLSVWVYEHMGPSGRWYNAIFCLGSMIKWCLQNWSIIWFKDIEYVPSMIIGRYLVPGTRVYYSVWRHDDPDDKWNVLWNAEYRIIAYDSAFRGYNRVLYHR